MAWSRAAWVFGGVRLISSARTMFEKIGPRTKRKFRLPGGRVLVDDLRAGDVAGHQVRRELNAAEPHRQGLGNGRNRQRLGQPRHADGQAVSPREHAHEHLFDHFVLADDDLVDLLDQGVFGQADAADRLFWGHLGGGGRHERSSISLPSDFSLFYIN